MQRLLGLGYKEAKKKPGLFYKRCIMGVAFVRLGWHSSYGSSWHGMWFSFKFQSKGHPTEKEKDIVMLQLKLLKIDFNPCEQSGKYPESLGRLLSYDICERCYDQPRPKDCWLNSLMKNIGQDIVEFERSPQCVVCHRHFCKNWKSSNHHVEYFPEEIVSVHPECHTKIHHTNEFLHLRPPDGDSAKFYDYVPATNTMRLPPFLYRLCMAARAESRAANKAARAKAKADDKAAKSKARADAKALRMAKAKRERDAYEAKHRPSARHNIVTRIPVDEKARDTQLAKEKAIIDRMRSKFA